MTDIDVWPFEAVIRVGFSASLSRFIIIICRNRNTTLSIYCQLMNPSGLTVGHRGDLEATLISIQHLQHRVIEKGE